MHIQPALRVFIVATASCRMALVDGPPVRSWDRLGGRRNVFHAAQGHRENLKLGAFNSHFPCSCAVAFESFLVLCLNHFSLLLFWWDVLLLWMGCAVSGCNFIGLGHCLGVRDSTLAQQVILAHGQFCDTTFKPNSVRVPTQSFVFDAIRHRLEDKG